MMMKELLIGCGHSRVKRLHATGDEEWHDLTMLDFNPDCKPDVVHDLNILPLPFEAGSFDKIYAFEVLEHCGRQGDWKFFFKQWEDFYRIIKPNGLFFGTCPHWKSNWAWGDPSHTRIVGIEQLMFLDQTQYEQVGNSAMTDFRPWYKADWRIVSQHLYENGTQCFVLQAVKP